LATYAIGVADAVAAAGRAEAWAAPVVPSVNVIPVSTAMALNDSVRRRRRVNVVQLDMWQPFWARSSSMRAQLAGAEHDMTWHDNEAEAVVWVTRIPETYHALTIRYRVLIRNRVLI
jgi:hypothetical protein